MSIGGMCVSVSHTREFVSVNPEGSMLTDRRDILRLSTADDRSLLRQRCAAR